MSNPLRLYSGMRGHRYGEIFLAFLNGTPRVELYNTTNLNDCPLDLWEALDADAIAEEFGATAVVLNGPRHWVVDGIGKIDPVEPLEKTFGGIGMRCVGVTEFDGVLTTLPYVERRILRGTALFFDAKRPVHELSSPEGRRYVMHGYSLAIDPTLDQRALPALGDRLDLPAGWTYESRDLADGLIIDTVREATTIIQDELHNTYTLVGE